MADPVLVDGRVRRPTRPTPPSRDRRRLLAALDAALESLGTGSAVAVVLCDLDRFRTLNEVHGPAVGDQVLHEVSRRLADAVPHGAVVERSGSDEFLVCAPAGDEEAVHELVRRLSTAFAERVTTSRVEVRVTASTGVVVAPRGARPATGAEALLRDAGTAMSEARAQGGGRVVTFHDGLRHATLSRGGLEHRLSHAVERDEIVVHYQPLVTLPGREVVGFEALARWRQGTELLGPQTWIPLAESTGLIHDIGLRVLHQAVGQLRQWQDAGHDVGVCVNVSARQLSSREFPDAVAACVAEGLPVRSLTLEVTESLAVEPHAREVLAELRADGVGIALDDFGTGYSALAAVCDLPVDVLKVDRSIVRRAQHRDGRAVLAAVVALGGALDLSVVAEGVGTADDEAVLRSLGCGLAQGYLYGRPADAAEATRLLRSAPPDA